MRVLVVYDSQWGNTEAIARAIGEALGAETRVERASVLTPSDLAGLGLLVVGSPTQGGRPLASVTKLLGGLSRDALTSTHAAAFDTRLPVAERGFALRLLMRTIGYAAPKITKALEAKGAQLVVPPEGFLVEDKEGPLKPGERERAALWAASMRDAVPR